MNQLVFYKNWWELAQLQTDDALRLAFYDAIFDYAFEGKVPPEVGRDGAKEARAARFAYITVQPVVERAVADVQNGMKGGRPRKKQSETPLSEKQKPPFLKKQNPHLYKENEIEGNGKENRTLKDGCGTSTTATVEDVENYFKRVSQTTMLRVTDEERSEFTEWLVLNEFKTNNGIVIKSRIGATFTAWRAIRKKELAKEKPADSDVFEEVGHRNITEDDL